jgi:hypothetical protein
MCLAQNYVPVPTGHMEGNKYLLSCWGWPLLYVASKLGTRCLESCRPPSGDKGTGMSSFEANGSGFPLAVASRDLFVYLLFELG